MASEEDNFDIDIYGDGENENQGGEDFKDASGESPIDAGYADSPEGTNASAKKESSTELEQGDGANEALTGTDDNQPSTSEGTPQTDSEQHSPRQGTKRKEAPDDRPLENGATNSLLISDLHWWTTDDDIRGWVNQSEAEDELKDVTFHEHKVNGKSKGQAHVELASPHAASAVKRKIDSFNENNTLGKKHNITFALSANPFRTLPKDAPARAKDGTRNQDGRSGSAGFHSPSNPNPGPMNFGQNNSGGFRGGRGGYNRGGMNSGGYQNRSFSGPMAGPPHGGFQGAPMGGFQGAPMGGMQNYGGYPNRGAMMNGMRGGRGNRGGMAQNPMMGGMPNMGMPMPMPNMGAMGGNMPMGQMGMQAPSGYQQSPSPHYNPNFYNQNQGGGGEGSWNPHGAKRPRPE